MIDRQENAASKKAPLMSLDEIHAAIKDCTACDLYKTRNMVVFDSGIPNASIVIVGEAPGESEDQSGKPFQGKCGKELNSWLREVGLDRNKVFIVNAVMCRPPNNRDPHVSELKACRKWFCAQLEIINPKVIVLMGEYAIKQAMQPTEKIKVSELHEEVTYLDGTPCVLTYHPGAAIRSREIENLIKEDLKLAKNILFGKLSKPNLDSISYIDTDVVSKNTLTKVPTK